MGANIKVETLGDIVRRQMNVDVTCGCGHRGILDGAKLERWYACHMWSTRIDRVREHLYCLRCGGRPDSVRIRPTSYAPTAAKGRFPANEDAWRRLVKGLRG